MKQLFALLLVCTGLSAGAQNIIWSHAIGNWRNGPVVYISPVIQTTEAETKPQLAQFFRREFPDLKSVTDLDVLLFGSREEAEESRTTLQAKYSVRRLEVVMLEVPAIDGH